MDTHNKLAWYHRLREFPSLDAIFADFQPAMLPDDWVVYMTDVVGSTKAIEAGRYKDVNSAGSLPTMALANFLGTMDFPFVFGGDGMTALLPRSLDAPIRAILGQSRDLAMELWGLELRAGAVDAAELAARGSPIMVARIRMSPHYCQAMLWGEGLSLAEDLVKGRDAAARRPAGQSEGLPRANPWLIPATVPGTPAWLVDFSGFSCRWQPIRSHLGQTISLLVQALGPKPEQILAQALHRIRELTGSDESSHPINLANHRLNADPAVARLESRVTGFAAGRPGLVENRLRQWLRTQAVRLTMTAARIILRLNLPGIRYMGKEVRDRPADNRRNADIRKVEGMLKMVIACTPEQGRHLADWLAEEHGRGRIRYGFHLSEHALMTCFVHDKSGNEVHFVDADGGGYALAAKMLKGQIAAGREAAGGTLPG